jgi:hypothetical protein
MSIKDVRSYSETSSNLLYCFSANIPVFGRLRAETFFDLHCVADVAVSSVSRWPYLRRFRLRRTRQEGQVGRQKQALRRAGSFSCSKSIQRTLDQFVTTAGFNRKRVLESLRFPHRDIPRGAYHGHLCVPKTLSELMT